MTGFPIFSAPPDRSMILCSSAYLYQKLSSVGFVPDTYKRVIIDKNSFTMEGVTFECHVKGIGEYQVRSDSFLALIRVLRGIGDTPILLQFGPDSVITIKEMIL